MKDPILEQIAAYRVPEKLPPIADIAFALYATGDFALNDEALNALRIELDRYDDDLKGLTDAICGLGAFALYIRDTRNDHATAEVVVRLIGEYAPRYNSIGERIIAALQDVAEKATGLLDRFTDRDSADRSRAPQFADEPPSGTVPLKAIKPLHEETPRQPPKKKRKRR